MMWMEKVLTKLFQFKYLLIENSVEYEWQDMSNMSLVEPEMAEENVDVQMQGGKSNMTS
jgi:hypothetical protein